MGFSSSGGAKVGSIEMFGGTTPPDGYLLCNGGAISRSLYSDLFAVIGTTYGAGDGSTTFNLPNYTSASMVASSIVAVNGTGKMGIGLIDASNNTGALHQGIKNNSYGLGCYPAGYGQSIGTSGGQISTGLAVGTLGLTTDSSKSGVTGALTLANSCKFIIKY